MPRPKDNSQTAPAKKETLKKGRNPQGVGTFEPRGPGRYLWKVWVGRDPVSGKPIRHTEMIEAKTEAQARTISRKLKAALDERPIAGAGVTLEDCFAMWVRELQADGRVASYVGKSEEDFNRVWKPTLGARRVGDIKMTDVQGVLNNLQNDGKKYTTSTMKKYLAPLSGTLGFAVRHQWFSTNVATLVTLPKPKSKGPDKELADSEDVHDVITLVSKKNPIFGALMTTEWATGARRAETAALRWDAIELHGDFPRIHYGRAITKWKRHWELKSPKGNVDHSVRDIGIADSDLLPFLKDWHDGCVARAAKVGLTLEPDGYVFASTPDGHVPINIDTLTDAVRKARIEINKGRAKEGKPQMGRVWLHGLRHDTGFQMAMEGIPLPVIAAVLGHSRVTTSAIYIANAKDTTQAAGILGRRVRALPSELDQEEVIPGDT
jgi:integrase